MYIGTGSFANYSSRGKQFASAGPWLPSSFFFWGKIASQTNAAVTSLICTHVDGLSKTGFPNLCYYPYALQLYSFRAACRGACEQVPVLRFRRIVHFHVDAHGAAPAEDRQPLRFGDFCSVTATNPCCNPVKCKIQWIWWTTLSMKRKSLPSATRRTTWMMSMMRVSGGRKDAGFLAWC